MNTIPLDLALENQVNIGATYRLQIQLCNAPDLTLYTGLCQVRQSVGSPEVILTPRINILSKDIFEIYIPHTDFSLTTLPGSYLYDVAFNKLDNTDRFYAVAGKIQLVRRVTEIV